MFDNRSRLLSVTDTMQLHIRFLLVFKFVNAYTLFSDIEAQKFLNVAAAAYAESSNVTARQDCLDLSFPDDEYRTLMVMSTPCDKFNNQCQAFVAASDTTRSIIISFRGTNTGVQLLTEFVNGLQDYMEYNETDASNRTISVGHANIYFLRAMDKMWDSMVYPTIKNRSNYTFLLTGHSLGGAMATLTAFRIAFREYSSMIKVHTFGEPRVGDLLFAKQFSKYVPYAFRVVHATDPIPHLPPLSMSNPTGEGQPYHHPREVWYNKHFTNYVLCSETEGEDWGCSDKEKFWDYGLKGAQMHTHYFNKFVSEYGALGCKLTCRNGLYSVLTIVMLFSLCV